MNFTYMLMCGDGSLYTGWTNDIEKRLKVHRSGKGAKYTRGRGPLTLVHLEAFETKSEAMKREVFIKSLTREEKEQLLVDKSWKNMLEAWKIPCLMIEDEQPDPVQERKRTGEKKQTNADGEKDRQKLI